MSETMAGPSLAVDTEQHYACENCPARCCRFPWQIDVTPEEYARYQQSGWIQEHLQQHGTALIPVGSIYKLPRVKQPDGGQGCVFLDTDNLCLIQKREGHGAIPKTCQNYPFIFNRAPEKETVYPFTSFFCKSILENTGEPLSASIQRRYDHQQHDGLIRDLPENLTLAGIRFPRAAYLAWSDWLEAIFAGEDLSAPQILLLGRKALWSLVMGAEGGEITAQQVAEAIKSNHQPPSMYAASKTLAGRAITALEMIPLTYEPLDLQHGGKGGYRLTSALIGLLFQLILGKGQVGFWGVNSAVDLQAAAKISLHENEAAFQSEIKRYYRSLLRGKAIFSQGEDFLKTFFLLGANYAAILRMARYVAQTHQRSMVDVSDIREAIGLTAAIFSHRNRMDQNILDQIKRTILEILAAREDTFERLLRSESY